MFKKTVAAILTILLLTTNTVDSEAKVSSATRVVTLNSTARIVSSVPNSKETKANSVDSVKLSKPLKREKKPISDLQRSIQQSLATKLLLAQGFSEENIKEEDILKILEEEGVFRLTFENEETFSPKTIKGTLDEVAEHLYLESTYSQLKKIEKIKKTKLN